MEGTPAPLEPRAKRFSACMAGIAKLASPANEFREVGIWLTILVPRPLGMRLSACTSATSLTRTPSHETALVRPVARPWCFLCPAGPYSVTSACHISWPFFSRGARSSDSRSLERPPGNEGRGKQLPASALLMDRWGLPSPFADQCGSPPRLLNLKLGNGHRAATSTCCLRPSCCVPLVAVILVAPAPRARESTGLCLLPIASALGRPPITTFCMAKLRHVNKRRLLDLCNRALFQLARRSRRC